MITFSDIFKFLIEFIGVSLLLYLIYIVCFRYRCKYNLARIYLLAIPIVALLSVSFTFNVIPLREKSVNIISSTQSQQIRKFVKTAENTLAELPINRKPLSAVTEAHISQDTNENTIKVFDLVLILGVLYLLGFIVRSLIIAIQVYKISSIKRWSTREKFKDIILYRSGLIQTPFSFMHNIFIDRKIEGSKLEIIVQHELSHIKNKHYLDKNAIELMCVFMWFNPIVWYIRRELGDIHEFQADNNVIKDGTDIKTYQYHLFEEIMHKSPTIANGFNHSLIKKRMLMMVDSRKIKHPILRTAFAVVSLVVVFVTVSFKQIEAESKIEPSIRVQKELSMVNTPRQESLHTALSQIEPLKNAALNIKTEKLNKIENQIVKARTLSDSDIITDTSSHYFIKLKAKSKSEIKSIKFKNKEVKEEIENSNEYILSSEQIKGIPDYYIFGDDLTLPWSLRNKVVGVEINQNETLVDFVISSHDDTSWCRFSERIFLRDRSTDHMYKVRSIKGDIPLGKRLIIKDHKYELICFTLIFPPLPKDVKKIDFIELESETALKSTGGGALFADYGISIRKLQKRKAKSAKLVK